MQKISVHTQSTDSDEMLFRVQVQDDSSMTTHVVKMNSKDVERLAKAHEGPVELLTKAFRFLLEREPKEAILREFQFMDIATYFPEFERELQNS